MSKDKPAGLEGDPPVYLAISEIAMISQLAMKLFESVLPEGMTIAQNAVLNHLLRHDTEQTIGALAKILQVRQPTMSSTVRKLENKGFVELRGDPDDRRIRRVAVTEAGKAARQAGLEAVEPLYAKMAKEMPEREFEDILPTLTKLRALLDRHRPD